ncbi:MAG: DUF5009 domain-containing protein [Paramuribaculum sp.]|nr:DUF5009 domain-containing protein [Paramuribaculum sp.]
MSDTPNNIKSPRLVSLDILRGLDLFLLVFFQPVFMAVVAAVDIPWLNAVAFQFDHEVWAGFRLWDIVMPLFLFMVGTSMPFSLAKYRGHKSKRAVIIKVFRRAVILFLLGMVVQGNLLSFDCDRLCYYNNTLQAIAVGYLVGALVTVSFCIKWRIVIAGILLIVYWLPMTFGGNIAPDDSFAYMVDRMVIGGHTDDFTYTWIWSSLNFSVTVLLGSFAGNIIKSGMDKVVVAKHLTFIGLLLVLAGILWSLQMPIIKRVWSSSMVLYSGGICFLLMALFYYVIDYRGYTYGLNWLKIYGMNAITAYVVGEVIDFRSIVVSLSYGLEPIMGEFYSAWLTFGNYLILFFILTIMYRRKIFIKI